MECLNLEYDYIIIDKHRLILEYFYEYLYKVIPISILLSILYEYLKSQTHVKCTMNIAFTKNTHKHHEHLYQHIISFFKEELMTLQHWQLLRLKTLINPALRIKDMEFTSKVQIDNDLRVLAILNEAGHDEEIMET